MSSRHLFAAAGAMILSSTLASAATFKSAPLKVLPSSGPILFQGVDISPVIQNYQDDVRIVDQTFTVYNWSTGSDNEFWQTERPDGDPSLIASSTRGSRAFWSSYGGPSDSMYGQGLYTAEDPVATFSYGGSVDSFVLLQLQIPKNFRMLDLVFTPEHLPSDSVKAASARVMGQFDCPLHASAETLFNQGGNKLNPRCRELVREVFANQLKIDGFAYAYSATTFKDCKLNMSEYAQLAFVITSSYWMNADSVHYYTTKSRRNLEERIRIQTLFMKAASQDSMKPSLSSLVDYLDAHPESELIGSKTKCDGDTCVITVHFCDAKNNCDDVALDPIQRPFGGTITQNEAQTTTPRALLWSDLLDKNKTATITTWLQSNMYGCNGKTPYQQTRQKGGK